MARFTKQFGQGAMESPSVNWIIGKTPQQVRDITRALHTGHAVHEGQQLTQRSTHVVMRDGSVRPLPEQE